MSFRRRYTLPELFVLLSLPQRRWHGRRWPLHHQPRAALMHQLVRLAKEGLREYDQRLNRLVHHYEDRYEDRDDRLDAANLLEDRVEDELESVDSCALEDEAGAPRCLSRAEIQLIFAALATRRYRLNARGYPYTSDVNEERERVFPWSEPLENDAVRDAWDDWRDHGGKKLFRRDSRAHPESERRHHAEREERNESEEFSEEMYACLLRVLRDLDSRRQPCDAKTEVKDDDDEEADCAASTESNSSRSKPASECLFEVFDELALSPSPAACGLGSRDGPDFREVNLRLVERGEVELEDEDDLRLSWRAYLVAAASARGAYRRGPSPHDPQDEPLEAETIQTETVASVVEISAVPDGGPFSARRRKPWRPT